MSGAKELFPPKVTDRDSKMTFEDLEVTGSKRSLAGPSPPPPQPC